MGSRVATLRADIVVGRRFLHGGVGCRLRIVQARAGRYPKSPVAKAFFGAFFRALQLKQNLALSRSKYKLVFFVPGDRFDPDTMTRDGDGESAFVPERVKRRHHGWPRLPAVAADSTVKLCLFPALYSKPERELTYDSGSGVALKDCLVKSGNFVRGNADMGLDGFDLLVRAVVLV